MLAFLPSYRIEKSRKSSLALPASPPEPEQAPQPCFSIWLPISLLLGALLCNCTSRLERPQIEEAFVARRDVKIQEELLPDSPVVGTLELGARVEIVGRRRRFVKVRTSTGVEGWTTKSKLIGPEDRDLIEQLRRQTESYPAQGVVRAFRTLNVHLEPWRGSRTIYQLREDEAADLLRHRLVDRLSGKPLEGELLPKTKEPEDWYLLRLANGQPGWVLTTGVYAAIPDEVAQYAERMRITSYFTLGEVEDPVLRQNKKTWLWTQIKKSGQPYDFDLMRVFLWSRRRQAYQTIKIERGLKGYLPVEIHPQLGSRYGTGTGFSITIEKKGQRLVRTYVLVGQRVQRVGEEPAPPPPPPIRLQTRVPPPPPPPSLVDRILAWWN